MPRLSFRWYGCWWEFVLSFVDLMITIHQVRKRCIVEQYNAKPYRLLVTFVSIDCVIITAFSNSFSIKFLCLAPDDSSLCFSRWCSCITELVVTISCDIIFEHSCDVTEKLKVKSLARNASRRISLPNITLTISAVHINIFRRQFLGIVRFCFQHAATHAGYTTIAFMVDRYTSWTWRNGRFAICWRDRLSFFWTWIILTETGQIYYTNKSIVNKRNCRTKPFCLHLPLLKAFVRPRRRFMIPAAVFELLYCLSAGASIPLPPPPLTLFWDEIVGRATPPLVFAFSASESLC